MTVHYARTEIEFTTDDSEQDFDSFLDRVTDELLDMNGVIDPFLAGSLAERRISVVMAVEADSTADAVRLVSANLRAALHAAECETRGWPSFPEPRIVEPA